MTTSKPMTTDTRQPLWQPDPMQIAHSAMHRFLRFAESRHSRAFNSYMDLHRWSVSEREAFWADLWEFFEVVGTQGKTPCTDANDFMKARWFPEASLNFAENLMRYQDPHTALICCDETGERKRISYRELHGAVAQLRAFLVTQGVQAGDRVAGILPNAEHAVIAMLATSSLGAIWSSCSPEFGEQGILDRLSQVQPRVLFAVERYLYAGKQCATLATARAVASQLASLQRLVIVADSALDLAPNEVLWQQALTSGSAAALTFARLPFNHPLYILFSSGTTGKPKCIVHGQGGTLLQHLKELALHTDVNRQSVLFFYSTCGWMMWNWLVSGLALGCTLVLYDGSPFHPGPDHLPKLAERLGITHFGAGAKYYSAAEKAGVIGILGKIQMALSTGSPLSPESFRYIHDTLFPGVQVASISGGTDIVSCFALGNPLLPVYAGELQGPGLGMDITFVDDEGREALEKEGRGEKGELICRQPFPSQPIGFWQDADGKKYRAAYFDRFPVLSPHGTWAHGDYGCLIRHDQPEQIGIQIFGRSDAVLNPGGVRIGTAEIYRQVEQVEEVLEAIAIAQQWQDDVRIVLFVRLQPGYTLDAALKQKIVQQIRSHASPRHVPAVILEVEDIPRTLSGKLAEIAVRQVVHGEEVKNRDALANPQALELFRNLEALQH